MPYLTFCEQFCIKTCQHLKILLQTSKSVSNLKSFFCTVGSILSGSLFSNKKSPKSLLTNKDPSSNPPSPTASPALSKSATTRKEREGERDACELRESWLVGREAAATAAAVAGRQPFRCSLDCAVDSREGGRGGEEKDRKEEILNWKSFSSP